MGLSSARNGQVKTDISSSAAGTAVTALAHVADWADDGTRPSIDVTCMGDGNEVGISGFASRKLTITGFLDDLTDAERTAADGRARPTVYCDDTTATTKRWTYGLYTWELNRTGGAGKAKAFTMTGTPAGTLTDVFQTATPSYP